MSENKVGGGELAVVMLLGIPATITWSGYVGAKVWNWFAVPFFDVPLMTTSTAVLAACLIAWMRVHPSPKKEESKPGDLIGRVVLTLFLDLMVLIVAKIAYMAGAA